MIVTALLALCWIPALTVAIDVKCTDHPAYTPDLKSELVSSWDILSGANFFSHYHPRYAGHRYAPVEDRESSKYANLDLFWANMDSNESGNDFIRLNLQREAKVYLLVPNQEDRSFPEASLPDWTSEGYAEIVEGAGNTFDAGVNQPLITRLPTRGHVFSMVVTDGVVLPHQNWIRNNVRGITYANGWIVLVAEKDGRATLKPVAPASVAEEIVPNKRCPDALHDLWVTANTDDSDDDTRGKVWPTWHPMWDPCYWCAYDHDHGSSPKHLMGYEPKFGYTAFKNGREDESHPGFKGIVFQHENFFIYFMIHGQTSKLRKLIARFHTISLVITDASTKEILLEFTHKGDFGFLSARAAEGTTESKFVPLSPEDAELEQNQLANGGARNKRSINVIDVDNPDPQFRFREPRERILTGEYEDWTTNTLCSPRGRRGMITTDFTTPAVGIKSLEERDTEVVLGFFYGSQFYRHDSAVRVLALFDFLLSEDNCTFEEGDFATARDADGFFYTDATGKKIVSGPGPDSVQQFMKPGFRVEITGIFRPVDPWVGLYQELKSSRGTTPSYGFGLDPTLN